MKKVLLISAPFFDYHISIGNAFRELGFEVKIEMYDEPIHPFKGLLKWRHKFSFNKEKLREKSRNKYDLYIKSVYDNYMPDIVFVCNGTILLDCRLDYFRKHSTTIIWAYDSVLRPDRTMCKYHIDHADYFFCFEKEDVVYYEGIGKKAYFLPMACDPKIYYPCKSEEKDIDILFVATLYTSKKRMTLAQSVVKNFPDANILIYGWYKPFVKNPIKWLFREKRHIFKNTNISPQEVNELLSRTKVALNIHNEQTLYGANGRVFEASAARAYQVCDKNPYLESIFPNDEMGFYSEETEMLDCIRWALDKNNLEERNKKAQQAYEIVMKDHTFKSRICQMLKIANIEY